MLMEEKSDKPRPFCLGETPWLMYTKERTSKRKQIRTFYSVSSSPVCYHKNFHQLHDKDILSSVHGWLILCDRDKGKYFSMFNLDTLQFINLPPLLGAPNHERVSTLSLTSPPECDDDCLLLLCFNEVGLMFFCRPSQPDCSWVTQKLRLQGKRTVISDIFTVKGVIYGFAKVVAKDGDSLIKKSFYVKDDLNSLTLRPLQIADNPRQHIPLHLQHHITMEYMVESCQCIYCVLIFIDYYRDDCRFAALKIYELDIDGQIWREINSLDGRTLFLNPYGRFSTTWCWGTANESESRGCIQGNCIYFLTDPVSYGSLHLYLYNVLDQSFMALSPCSGMENPGRNPLWVIPRLLSSGEWKERLEKEGLYHLEVGPTEYDQDLDIMANESMFSELPLHLKELISERMHLFEYWNFRATCKTFQSLCPPPQWETNNALPLFMSCKSSNGSCELIDPCRLDSYSSILQLLPDAVVFSKNGWLLALVGGMSLEFFNIFSGVRGNLPSFGDYDGVDYGFKSIAFSTNPTCSECLTVAMWDTEDGHVLIFYLQSGNTYWDCFSFEDYVVEFCASTSPPIFRAGAFYFLDTRGYLGVFQLVGGIAYWQVVNQPQVIVDELFGKFYSCYLVECAGTIYSVFMENTAGRPIKVFKFDDSQKHWVEIDNLGNYILFISRASCVSKVTSDPKMRNRIYLPRLRGSVVYYSLDTKMYHCLGSDDSMENLYGTKEPLRCCWI